jgi:hypothetical protein
MRKIISILSYERFIKHKIKEAPKSVKTEDYLKISASS